MVWCTVVRTTKRLGPLFCSVTCFIHDVTTCQVISTPHWVVFPSFAFHSRISSPGKSNSITFIDVNISHATACRTWCRENNRTTMLENAGNKNLWRKGLAKWKKYFSSVDCGSSIVTVPKQLFWWICCDSVAAALRLSRSAHHPKWDAIYSNLFLAVISFFFLSFSFFCLYLIGPRAPVCFIIYF